MTKKKYYVKKSENQKEYLILDKEDNHCVCVLNIEQINQGIKDWINDFEKRIQKNEIKRAIEQPDYITKNDLLNKLNEQYDRNEKLKSINYQLSARCHDYEKSLYNGREYLKKLNEKFEKNFGISLENFLNIDNGDKDE